MLLAASALLALLIASTTSYATAPVPSLGDTGERLHLEVLSSSECETGLVAVRGVSSQCARVLDTPDLDGDGRLDVILSFPSTCDDDGKCDVVAAVRREGTAYCEVLPATRVWDMVAEPVARPFVDLRETRVVGSGGAALESVLWRFDGERYSVVPGSREALIDEP